ncbi:MCP methyltransferase, CheR-type [Thermodesulfobium narugense DSM 14796]|uniref:protein-glutamate O-methyltransferase n=1 Tax=Thermodesulfobium narugense DSM 14796 TaxID=747365 RepID=M1E4M2_9BACT|nr:protein-glutamate O-methyltransferase CheR [Thermodesulfobium narugense]AEE13671.1 MCP methyltransferase, CheR-type [Thermodesulfobium narugense DSM 14796]
MDDQKEYKEFTEEIFKLTNIPLHLYRENQVRRRVTLWMSFVGLKSFKEYLNYLKSSPKALEEFKKKFTINVSEFFRNPELFDELKKYIPELAKKTDILRVYSAGCSVGAEAYTVAIILNEYFKGTKYHIWGLDIDEEALEKAKLGIYTKDFFKSARTDLIEKYFNKMSQDKYQIKDEIKTHTTFLKGDLILGEPPRLDFDIVLCRNVVIYFDEEAKDKVYANLSKCLKVGGILFVGATERVFDARRFSLEYVSSFIYRKV